MNFTLTPEHYLAAGVLSTIIILETLFPFRIYLDRAQHYGKNIVFSVFNGLITGVSSAGMSICVLTMIDNNKIGLLNQFAMPPWATTVCALLAFDAWIYSWHRMNHTIPFLWRFHQVHHNDLEMDMSTALRFHPGEILMASVLNAGIFMVVGMNIEHIILYKGIFHTNVMIQHSNVGIPEKLDAMLRLVIVTPNMHRVHHSVKQKETDSNFSSVLTIWDRTFGTFRESDPEKIVFGLETDRTPDCQTVPYLLKLPFKRTRQISIEEAKKMMAEGEVAIVDVRKPQDYETSHIDGALLLHGEKLDQFLKTADKSKPIICYCYKGISSKGSCQKLAKAGFRRVYNLKGGYDAWKDA